ncbi:MAG: hypothetical protein RL753_889, partial [Bacteroidota bacterium]
TDAEIADLVGARHDNVKRAIERLAERGVIELPPTEEMSTATKPVTVYRFAGEQGKRDSIVVVAPLSPEFTARLADRWQELEGEHRPMTRLEWARLQVQQVTERETVPPSDIAAVYSPYPLHDCRDGWRDIRKIYFT